MSDQNGISGLPDVGAIRQRQREKEQVPPYTVGTPEFAMQVAVQSATGLLSFRDALEMATDTVGRSPSITYMHSPPLSIADVR